MSHSNVNMYNIEYNVYNIIKRTVHREWPCVIISSLNVADFFSFARMQR